MSTFGADRLPSANGHNGDNHVSALDHLSSSDLGEDAAVAWGEDEALRQELELLAAEHKELLSSAGLVGPAEAAAPDEGGVDARELGQVRAENGRLRARVEELEQLLQAAAKDREQTWAEQQHEYEALLEEKSEVIRSLHLKVQELKETAETPPAAETADGTSRTADLKEELEVLRQQLERERGQLEEDEAALEEQMKQMELTMSRDRVEVARQRSELQRLQNDFQHELEMASRDEKLRERLAPLQRRHQEIMNSKGAAAGPPPRPSSSGQLPRPTSVPNLGRPGSVAPTPGTKKSSSGLFRRLFRGGEQ